MGALVVAVLCAQVSAPASAVVLTRRTGVSGAEGQALAGQVAAVLVQAQLPGVMPAEAVASQLKKLGLPDPSSCAGRKDCIIEVGKQLGVSWVYSVSVARVEKDRSVGLELVNVDDGATLERDAVLVPPKTPLAGDQLSGFIDRVKARLAPPKPPDAPVVVVTTPKPPPEPVVPPPPPPSPEPPPRSHVASFVLGGLGLAALAAGGVTLTLGLLERRGLQSAVMTVGDERLSSLTRAEATRRNDAANLQLILSSALGGLALALGTVALVVW